MSDLYNIFKLNSNQIELSPGQQEIFNTILYLKSPRVQAIAPTQYGKSLTVALATLLSAVSMGEKWTIIAGSEKKALIIMRYVIDHIFDDQLFTEQLELDSSNQLDRLKRERSRTNITFKTGGGVQVLTLDARNTKRSIEAAMGFGGNRLILDESSLIEDRLYSTVKRMLGGYKYSDTFLFEIGNPFYRNHFLRTWQGTRYKKIFIDYKQGLEEGRFSPEFIEEMREEAFFDVLYECKFPDADAIDARGYRSLLSDTELLASFVGDVPKTGELRLGVDIGGGGDYNVYVLRSREYAWVESKNRSNDTMTNVSEVQRIIKDYGVKPEAIFIDDIGVGRGVADRLKELGISINGVSVGSPAVDKTRYKNIKAEISWLLRSWIVNGGKLEDIQGFRQLLWIKYKVSTDKVIQIEPKQDLITRTGKSPDYADALALTFATGKARPSVRFI